MAYSVMTLWAIRVSYLQDQQKIEAKAPKELDRELNQRRWLANF
jgi:hypothetical protein